jgi:hypothetical protein
MEEMERYLVESGWLSWSISGKPKRELILSLDAWRNGARPPDREQTDDICRTDGCDEPRTGGKGRYGSLCEQHRREAVDEWKRLMSVRRWPSRPTGTGSSDDSDETEVNLDFDLSLDDEPASPDKERESFAA